MFNTNYHELPTNYSYNINVSNIILNVSNMKKEYIQPAMRVVNIQQHKMLCGSPYNDVKTPVSTYNDDEDAITDKGNVW